MCLNPLEGFEKMSSFGFKVVSHEVVGLSPETGVPVDEQLEDHFQMIRRLRGTEGRVVYFLNGERQVIGLLKKKSAWYIILRALREKIKSYLFHKGQPSTFSSFSSFFSSIFLLFLSFSFLFFLILLFLILLFHFSAFFLKLLRYGRQWEQQP